ncbi:MAG TPA: anthrone oxygenase family protein, partial [Pyrinomonadaceae bacterium]|nr:anthrone oxygenase family protein [Pyrinomonadaceae bacterium]
MSNRRTLVTQVCLWLFVSLLALQLGAGAYETRVVVPLWTGAPPESVWGWNADARYALRPFERFWIFATPPLAASALACIVASWKTRTAQRRWVLASCALTLLLVAATYAYFVPVQFELLSRRAEGLSGEEVTAKAERWLLLHRLRAPFYLTAWL